MSTRLAVTGAIIGLIAGVAMAMYAMIAGATYLGTGFFTPMYHIASPLIGPQTMETSMKSGPFYFAAVPAVIGMGVHLLWAMLYGVIFAFIASALRLVGGFAVIAGIVYGVVVMLFMSFAVLPLVGQATMPSMVGWPTFSVEHALYGFVLGLWPIVRPSDLAVSPLGAPRTGPI